MMRKDIWRWFQSDETTIKREISKKKNSRSRLSGNHYEFFIHKKDKSGYLLTLINKEKIKPKLKM